MLKTKTLNLGGETRRHEAAPGFLFCFLVLVLAVCVGVWTIVGSSPGLSMEKGVTSLVSKQNTFMAESWLALANLSLPTDLLSYQIFFC